MKRKHLFFVMLVITVALLGSLIPTEVQAGRKNQKAVKILTAPVRLPIKAAAALVGYRSQTSSHPDYRLQLTNGRHKAIIAMGRQIGISRRAFSFGVKANTIQVSGYETLVPYRYTYWWNGKEYSRSIDAISQISIPKSAQSGYSSVLAVNVFYKKVKTIRNHQYPHQIRQETEVMITPAASNSWTIIFW